MVSFFEYVILSVALAHTQGLNPHNLSLITNWLILLLNKKKKVTINMVQFSVCRCFYDIYGRSL